LFGAATALQATTPPIKESYLNFSLDIPSRTADGKPPSLLYLLEHFFEVRSTQG
jgi:hypothetical protein